MIRLRLWLLVLILALSPALTRAQTSLEVLIEEALLPRLSGAFSEGARLEVHLPPEAPATALGLIALEYDRATQMIIVTPATGQVERQQYRGRVRMVIDVLVPIRPIQPGEITKANDFEMRSIPAQNMGRFALSDSNDIIGREARRLLPEGRPVQAQSLQEPRIIKRGQKVELIYARGGLELSAPAKSLEDGAEGDVIRVQNLNSNRTVRATPAGEGRVMVVQ